MKEKLITTQIKPMYTTRLKIRLLCSIFLTLFSLNSYSQCIPYSQLYTCTGANGHAGEKLCTWTSCDPTQVCGPCNEYPCPPGDLTMTISCTGPNGEPGLSDCWRATTCDVWTEGPCIYTPCGPGGTQTQSCTGPNGEPGTMTCTRATGCDQWVCGSCDYTPIDPCAGLNTSSTSNVTVCGGSYYWSNNGQTYSSSGTYYAYGTNSYGCPHTYILNLTIGNPISVSAGPASTITCLNPTANLSATVISGYVYSWSPSAGLSSSTISNPVATPTATTTYTVTVTNANGCTATSSVLVTVNKPTPTANAGADATISCSSSSVSIGAASISGNSYSWSPTTGLSSSTISNPVATPTSTTTYTVTVTNANGCSATDVVVVTTNGGLPIANAGVDKALNCSITSTTLGSTSVPGYTYSWSPSTGLSSTSIAQPNASPNTSTNYTVTVTGTNGCTATDVVLVTVNNTPPTANAGLDKVINCSVNSVVIGTASIAGNTYLWSPSTTLSSSNIAQPTANPNTTTSYTVTVTGANGCTSSDVVVVTVDVVLPIANAGGTKNLNCNTISATIGSASVSGSTYSWSPNLGLSASNLAQPTVTANATTIYTVTVTGANGCTATSTVTVNVNKTQPVSGIVAQGSVCATETLALQASATNNNYSYQWSATGSPTASGATSNSTITYAWPSAAANTTQTVTLIVTHNLSGCTATYTQNVNVTTEVFANAGPDKTICQGASTQIGATPSGPAGATYTWSPNYRINSVTVANPTVNPLTTTTYTLTTVLNGCIKTDVVTVNVNVLLGPNAEAGNAVSTCAGQGVVIGGNPTSSSSNVSYLWAPSSNINNATLANPQVTTSTSGWYKVTVTNNAGCFNEDSVYVTVIPCLEISGNVFVDNNGPANVDGTGIGSPSGTQVYANLIGSNGNVVATVPVNSNGTYQFSNITPNTSYSMVLSTTQGSIGSPAPSAILPTGWSNVSEDCCDNTGNDGTTNGITSVTVATSNVSNINFGITQPLSLGNLVWDDVNHNGIKDATESGIGNATVKVYLDANGDGTPDGASLQTVTTNSNGLYVFNGLTPGNYVVGVTPPAPASGNAFISSAVNELNPNSNVDNNDNGITTVAGETRSGTVTLSASAEPTGETPNNGTAPDANSNLTVDFAFYQPVNLSGNVFVDNNGPANVDGTGIGSPSGTQVYANLIGSNGNVVATVPVNSNGTYQFNDVIPNTTYTMVLSTTQGTVGSPAPSAILPTGWSNVSEDCCDNTGNDGTTNGITSVTVGITDVPNVNFGITQPLSLGNLVWDDVNHNGIKDASETGIGNATVKVYLDANSDGTPDGAALQTVTTNSNGLYVFNGLTPGNYVVGVTPPAPASGNAFISSGINETNPNSNVDNNDNGITTVAGETRSSTVTLSVGAEPTGETPNNGTAPDANSNLTVDFAFYQPVNLSGNVFVDNNGPANVDGTGVGSPSGTQVYANLIGSNGNVVATVPVNSNGTYQFNDVMPNTTYTMVLSTTQGTIGNPAPSAVLPTGWSNVSEDCCDNTGNDGTSNGITTVVVGITDVPNVNFGIRQPLSLGNIVWKDVNRNGIQDNGEVGINAASVKLYVDANSDGTPDGAAIATSTTDANGLYIFNNINPGNYVVGVTPPTVTGGSYTSSIVGQELNPNLNVDANDNGILTVAGETRSGTITLAAGSEPLGETPNNAASGTPDANTNLTVDFGFFLCPANFTFTPQYVCPNNTLDLATLEPVNYTGGVWSQNGNPLTNKLVTNGTYVYTFTDGDCIATGSVTVGTSVPDYTPTITITPSAIAGTDTVRAIIKIEEILNRNSCSPIYVLIPRLAPRYSFSYQPTATSILGAAVNNADWQYFESNPNFYIWKYVGATTFPAGGTSRFGYYGLYDPNDTDGETTFSVQIFQGSGGETNQTNNTDSEVLIYFR